MTQRNAIDLIAERTAEIVGAQVRDLVLARITDLVPTAPAPTPEPEPEPASGSVPDARNRAARTAIQGAVATIVVAGLVAVADLLGTGTADLASSAGWKAVAVAAVTASLTAAASFVARIVRPPKGQ